MSTVADRSTQSFRNIRRVQYTHTHTRLRRVQRKLQSTLNAAKEVIFYIFDIGIGEYILCIIDGVFRNVIDRFICSVHTKSPSTTSARL